MNFVSDCCGESAEVAGGSDPGTGWPPRPDAHYICQSCGKACDVVPDEDADWDAPSQRWIPWSELYPAWPGRRVGSRPVTERAIMDATFNRRLL